MRWSTLRFFVVGLVALFFLYGIVSFGLDTYSWILRKAPATYEGEILVYRLNEKPSFKLQQEVVRLAFSELDSAQLDVYPDGEPFLVIGGKERKAVFFLPDLVVEKRRGKPPAVLDGAQLASR